MTIVKKTCDYCGKEFSGHHNTKFCSSECRLNHKRKYENEYSLRASLVKYPDGTDPYIFVECAICGLRSPDISGHVNKLHNITNEEYKLKYGRTKSQQLIDSVCGEKNPGYNHNGKFSPFSKNFINYESDEKIEKLVAKAAKSRVDNNNDTTKIEYYLSRGYSQEDAEIALSKRQTTFSLEKCIEKYGEEQGKLRWLERQYKWHTNYKKSNYSKISQELFWKIAEKLSDLSNIYFAELNATKNKCPDNINNEYRLLLSDKVVLPDFIDISKNKIIEFDGVYWHGEIGHGNQQRELDRDLILKESGFEVLHVNENDYKRNKDLIVQQCLNYLM
jgi:hypothetical protein